MFWKLYVDDSDADVGVRPVKAFDKRTLQTIDARLELGAIKLIRREECYGRIYEILRVQVAGRIAMFG